MMRVVKFSPAYGHNIEQFIRCFNGSGHELTILYFGVDSLSKMYGNVRFIKVLSFNGLKILACIVLGLFDVVWLHGGNRLLLPVAILKIISKCFSSNTLWVFNVWGERVVDTLSLSNYKSRIYMLAVKLYDVVLFNWYSLEFRFKGVVSGVKTETLLWGLPESFFKEPAVYRSVVLSESVTGKYKFFFPKSFTKHSAHILLAEAVKELSNRCDDFVVVIMEGNGREEDVYREFINYIKEENIERYFSFLCCDFYLNPYEMNMLWTQMDCGLQIVYKDQLSNTFVEPQACKKPIIASFIDSYDYYVKKFNVNVDLVNNDKHEISCAMYDVKCFGVKKNILKERYDSIVNNYIFENNFDKIMKELQCLSGKG